MFSVRLEPCGTNCFLIKKKKAKVDDLEGVCFSAFTGCQLPFFCSTAAQCEAAAAVADLGALVLCKAAALLVAGHGSNATFLHQEQTSADWKELVCIIVALFLHRLVFVCWVFAVGSVFVCGWWWWVCMTFLSYHTTICVFPSVCKCITGEKYLWYYVFTSRSGLRLCAF